MFTPPERAPSSSKRDCGSAPQQPFPALWSTFPVSKKRFQTLEIALCETPVASATSVSDYQLCKLLIRLNDFVETSPSSKQRTH
ncbi:hypothetical protein TNCV_439191 [Trichonephila clavipes]|nr:hypothetical protein TNCV_439191 [Trichonephila clavipes]